MLSIWQAGHSYWLSLSFVARTLNYVTESFGPKSGLRNTQNCFFDLLSEEIEKNEIKSCYFHSWNSLKHFEFLKSSQLTLIDEKSPVYSVFLHSELKKQKRQKAQIQILFLYGQGETVLLHSFFMIM